MLEALMEIEEDRDMTTHTITFLKISSHFLMHCSRITNPICRS